MHIMLLQNYRSVDLLNAFSTIMIFNTAMLLTKKLILQPEKCDLGPTFYHVPAILRQLAC